MSHSEQVGPVVDAYYRNPRPEMLRYVPAGSRRVLELGCGEGAFGGAVKQHTGAEYWAVEYDPAAAEKAGRILDRVLVGDADQLIDEVPDGYFDAIVCNDVLEHLAYPWVTLERLRPKLHADGVVVASIPNIRYMPALFSIIFRRDFPLDEEGIFDRTHLRFFTRKSIRRMFDTAGYEMETMKGITMVNPFAVLVGLLSFGFFWDGAFMQYACVASPRR
jgi:2-polyprenyl-3-methyl-5-hydroxy-6-metoxy-1,4-benzoquinol methylase